MFRKLIVLLAAPLALGAQQPTDTTLHPISLAEAIRLAGDRNVSNIIAGNSVRTANNSVRSARGPTSSVTSVVHEWASRSR